MKVNIKDRALTSQTVCFADVFQLCFFKCFFYRTHGRNFELVGQIYLRNSASTAIFRERGIYFRLPLFLMYIHTYLSIHTYVCMYVCMYVRMYVCMHVCMYVIIGLNIHTRHFK